MKFYHLNLEYLSIIDDFEKRIKISKEISKFILKKHTYQSRIRKILSDLNY